MTKTKKKWSQDATENSDAMDLKEGLFKSNDAKKIAESLEHSAERAIAASPAPITRQYRC